MMAVLDQVLERFEDVSQAAGFRVTVEDYVRDCLVTGALARPDGVRSLHREVERCLVAPLLGRDPGSYRAVLSGADLQVVPDTRTTRG